MATGSNQHSIKERTRLRRVRIDILLDSWSAYSDTEQINLFLSLPLKKRVALFTQLDVQYQEHLILSISHTQIKEITNEIDPDDLADIIQTVAKNVKELVRASLSPKVRDEMRQLLAYNRTNAAGIMTARFVAVPSNISVQEAIRYVRGVGSQIETIYYIYVIDTDTRLLGVLSLRDLLSASDNNRIAEIMEEDVITVSTETDQEAVAKILESHDFIALPVCDAQKHILGIITFDDVFDVIREEQTEDVYKMGAVQSGGGQYLNASVLQMVKRRVPWLIILLLLGTITTNILNNFETVIVAFTFLVWFLPVITQTGGNCGTQSATLVIRGLALGELHWRDVWRVISKEIAVGFLMGCALGVALLLRGIYLPPQITIYSALAISAALSIVVLVSSLIGAVFPLIIYKCGLDPTVMAGPLMATVIDGFGITLYLLIVQAIL